MEVDGASSPLSSDPEQLLIRIRSRKKDLETQIAELKSQVVDIQQELSELDQYDEEDNQAVDARDKVEKRIRLEFNTKPKKGIKELIEAGFATTPEDIAQWLFTTEGLKKKCIGEYMGEMADQNLAVLKAFSRLHDFAGIDFDQALRAYLGSFMLPGEAQKIDRMMEAFASWYCENNAGKFSHEDTCYVLAFATIMLNTSLHNPSVKDKQSLDAFLNMNRGIDQGQDLDIGILTGLYESISKDPFKMPEDEDAMGFTFVNPERTGWLVKEGGGHKSWKKRWFTLVNNCLYYFVNQDAKQPKGTIPLENLCVHELESHKKQNVFEVLREQGSLGPGGDTIVKGAKTNSKGQVVQGKHSSYKLQAGSREEMEDWIKCIQAAMQKDPIYEMFAMRRNKQRSNY